MLIFALITAVRTRPKPAVFPVFDSFYKVLADFVGRGSWVPMFTLDNFSEFC